MNLIDLFIQRPIFTWMTVLSLLVFGMLGYNRLGVDQFPEMKFPVVTVSAILEGASPEVMEEDVTDVIEEYLNTIAGVRELRSTTGQGVSQIVVEFDLDMDIEIAAQDVRDKLAQANRQLPPELEPPIVSKANFSDHPIMWIPLKSNRPAVELTEYVKQNVKPRLETIPGVAGIVIFGEQERNIRIWLDGEALRARGLAATDVLEAIRREHVEIPGGLVESHRVEFAVKTDAEFRTIQALSELVVAHVDGAPVQLMDVARVEDGMEDIRSHSRYDGAPAVGVGVRKQSDGNTVAIADEVLRRISQLQKILPDDMRFKEGEGVADFSRSIREAVAETIFSLQFGAVLATLTVFGFLRRWRPTLIVGAAIPFSLITTFGVMWLFDYTLNTMTLLAMTLAVGVVIDDAIVVLENIERHRDNGESPMEAASKGTREIAFAATAATVSIAVVFIPVVFVEGLIGNFLGAFGITVASAVLISLVIALTLTPMLAARIPAAKEAKHGSVYHRLEQGFDWLERHYRAALDWSIRHKAITLGAATASFFLALGVGGQLGGEFFPPSDEGRLFVKMTTPPGTHLDTSLELLKRNEQWILAQPEVAGLFSGVGTGGSSSVGNDPTEGIMFTMLTDRAHREKSAQTLVQEARQALGNIPGQKVGVFDMSGMMGGSDGGEVSFVLRGNLDLDSLNHYADLMVGELRARGGFVDIDKSLRLGRPELRVIPDREKAAALGVDASTLASTIRAMVGGMDIGTFKEGGRRFDIRVRLDEADRRDPSSIQKLYVRTRTGDVVELRNLVDVVEGAAPAEITRVDRQRSVTIDANLENIKLAQAIAIGEEIADQILPEEITLQFGGQAEAFQDGARQFMLALGLAILVIYMVLAAQFESLVHPFTVMLALPLALVGALGGLWLMDLTGKPGMSLNLFSMIGMILLFGLVTKNSILLVDYANQLRATGMDKVEAMRTAAPVRMRPVLMTAISMIFGVLPAAVGFGPGSESRAPMAVATAAGMFSSTILTLLVVPVFYLVLDDLVEGVKSRFARLRGAKAGGTPGADAAGVPVS